MALYTDKSHIIKIEIFMENFLGVTYDGAEKLTHNVMRQFLLEKEKPCPRRATFSHIHNEQVLRGQILLVKDQSGKTIGYYNPRLTNTSLLEQLMKERDPKKLEEIRRQILDNQNYLLLNDGSIVCKEEEETYEKTPIYKAKNRDQRSYMTGKHVYSKEKIKW